MAHTTSFNKLNLSLMQTDFLKFVRDDSKISWTITLHDFLQCVPNESYSNPKYLKSPDFPEDPNANFKWALKLYPFERVEEEEYSFIYLFLVSGKIQTPVSAVAIISCENNNNMVLEQEFLKYGYKNNGYEHGYYKYMKTSAFHSYLSNGPVTIYAKISVMYEANSYCTSNFASDKTLQNNYLNLYKKGTFSDVTFYTEDNTEFKVHMNILAARSKVFSAMLSNKIKENPTGKIIVDGCSGITMENLLSFIYSCKIEFFDVIETIHLLNASEKYELMDLRLQCFDYLSCIIDEENACSLLLIAENFNLPELKEKIFKYMQRHKRKFSSEDTYDLILHKKPRLLAEISAQMSEFDELNPNDN